MKNVKLKGIVLRSIDYKENSKICYMLTEEGIISIKALGTKGYKNKNFNFSEILNNCEMEITDSDFPSLIDYSLINSYSNIKKNFKNLSYVSMMLEATKALNGQLSYKRIYTFLITMLNTIEEGNDARLACAIYLIKLLMPLGIKPDFTSCSICRCNLPSYINPQNGQSYCENERVKGISINDIKTLYYFDISKDLDSLDVDLNIVYKFIYEYYIYHLDINLKKYDLVFEV